MAKSMKEALADALGGKTLKTGAPAKSALPEQKSEASPSVSKEDPGQVEPLVTRMTGKARASLAPSREKSRFVGQKPPGKPEIAALSAALSDLVPVQPTRVARRSPLARDPYNSRVGSRQSTNQARSEAQPQPAGKQDQKYYEHLASVYAPQEAVVQVDPRPPWTLRIDPTAAPNPFLIAKPADYNVTPPLNRGIEERMPGTRDSADVREMVIGLDFGTSSVKVVVGDMAAEIAYAVPFSDVQDTSRYLLPSRLWQANDLYSIRGGTHVHRDLKLALLSEGDADEAIHRASAFLALVIRHVRGWLFSEHAETYANAKLLWRVMLGMPAKKYEAEPERPYLTNRFRLVGRAAWLIAGWDIDEVNGEVVRYGVKRADALLGGAPPKAETEEIEVDVVPEISAQIYGFLNSDRFDDKAANRFMMVDVGAGTIDSSLFRVEKGKRGSWDFRFYTSEVQSLGVLNLHRARLQWWTEALKNSGQSADVLLNALAKHEYATDFLGAIPEHVEEYVLGANLHFRDADCDPDHEFFKFRVMQQVRGNTLYRAKDYLDTQDLAGIPTFLCGGGTRMNFYGKLANELVALEGVSWLNAKVRPLEMPGNLRAPGLERKDYDRLSVAYGLSFLAIGKIVRELPDPIAIRDGNAPTYQDRFVSKDQV